MEVLFAGSYLQFLCTHVRCSAALRACGIVEARNSSVPLRMRELAPECDSQLFIGHVSVLETGCSGAIVHVQWNAALLALLHV